MYYSSSRSVCGSDAISEVTASTIVVKQTCHESPIKPSTAAVVDFLDTAE